MKKIITKVFVAFMLVSMMTCTAFANGLVGSGEAVNVETQEGQTETSVFTENSSGLIYDEDHSPESLFGIRDVTTEELAGKLENKGNDIINLMQIVGRYICYGGFVMGVILMIAGCLGNKKMLMQGFIALIISGVAYAGIVCGREIVNFIASWAAS